MTNRPILPRWQFFDDNGDPLAGGKLYFYITGTDTPKTTYSDAGLTTENANPVILDAAGRSGDIYFSPGAYKMILANAADVSMWTADPVLASLTQPEYMLPPQTITAPVAAVDFINLDPDIAYRFVVDGVVPATSAQMIARFSSDNGVSFVSGASDYRCQLIGLASVSSTYAVDTFASYIILNQMSSVTVPLAVEGMIRLGSTTDAARFSVYSAAANDPTDAFVVFSVGAGRRATFGAHNAVRFLMGGGVNFVSGTFRLFEVGG